MTILSTQNLIINDKFSATHKHLFYRSLLLGLNRAGEWAIFFLQRETRLKSNLEIFITRLSFQVEKTKIPAPILSFRSFDEKSTFLQHFECSVSLIWLATALLCRINWWGALKLWCLLFFALSLGPENRMFLTLFLILLKRNSVADLSRPFDGAIIFWWSFN